MGVRCGEDGSDVGEVGIMWGEVGEMGATCSMSEYV